MQAFILGLIVKALENEKVRAFLLEFADKLGQFLLPRLAALIPAAAAAVLKVITDKIPGLPDLPDLPVVVDEIHSTVNNMLPQDVDIPILSDVVKDLTGFDLTDWLKGKR